MCEGSGQVRKPVDAKTCPLSSRSACANVSPVVQPVGGPLLGGPAEQRVGSNSSFWGFHSGPGV